MRAQDQPGMSLGIRGRGAKSNVTFPTSISVRKHTHAHAYTHTQIEVREEECDYSTYLKAVVSGAHAMGARKLRGWGWWELSGPDTARMRSEAALERP